MLSIAKNIVALFFPELCFTCECPLIKNEYAICTSCRNELPLTNFTNSPENIIEKRFYGLIELKEATALFYFHKNHMVQKLIHQLKYKGHQEIGKLLGNWLGHEIVTGNRFKNIDVIIPVPLHKKKLLKRGYNQLTVFCETLSNQLNVPVNSSALIKVQQRDSQTKKSKFNRWKNMTEQFELANSADLNGTHILLVDDIITTGATITNCAKVLFKIPHITLSIAVMAYTE